MLPKDQINLFDDPESESENETRAKKETSSKKKTDGKMKRPLTSYFRWAAEERASTSEKLTAAELGARWKGLSEEEQRPYKEAADEEMAEYKREMEAFK